MASASESRTSSSSIGACNSTGAESSSSSSSPSSSSSLTVNDYGVKEYWDRRYSHQNSSGMFDWYCDYSSLRPYLPPPVPPTDSISSSSSISSSLTSSASSSSSCFPSPVVFPLPLTFAPILHVGVGNSSLPFHFYHSHFCQLQYAIDISSVVIERMRRKQIAAIEQQTSRDRQKREETEAKEEKEEKLRVEDRAVPMENLIYMAMDACKMSFPSHSFGLVIDKGTIDALSCPPSSDSVSSSASPSSCSLLLSEGHRVLMPGGILLILSHGGSLNPSSQPEASPSSSTSSSPSSFASSSSSSSSHRSLFSGSVVDCDWDSVRVQRIRYSVAALMIRELREIKTKSAGGTEREGGEEVGMKNVSGLQLAAAMKRVMKIVADEEKRETQRKEKEEERRRNEASPTGSVKEDVNADAAEQSDEESDEPFDPRCSNFVWMYICKKRGEIVNEEALSTATNRVWDWSRQHSYLGALHEL